MSNENDDEEFLKGEYDYLGKDEQPKSGSDSKKKFNSDERQRKVIYNNLSEMARKGGKQVADFLEELTELYKWANGELKKGKVILSANANGNIRSSYTFDNKRDKIKPKEKDLLALIIDSLAPEYLSIGRYSESPMKGVYILDIYKDKKVVSQDFLEDQIEFYLRKPNIIELDSLSNIYKMSFKKFIQRFIELKGDDKRNLRKEYNNLFGENLPKLAHNKFRLEGR